MARHFKIPRDLNSIKDPISNSERGEPKVFANGTICNKILQREFCTIVNLKRPQFEMKGKKAH